MEYVKSDREDLAPEDGVYLQVLKPFSKNTVLFVKKYILDLICFERGLVENWNRKLRTSNPKSGRR